MTFQPTYIDVMRHGEPVGACPKGGSLLRGSIDHELSTKGWLQAEQRILSLRDELHLDSPWDVIISSPLKRCAAFAEKLASETLLTEKNAVALVIKDCWREIHYGDWEGLSTQSIWQQQPELMQKMWQEPLEFCAPNGEPVKDFSLRIEQAWLELLNEYQGKRILLVCHGGVMRLLLQQLLLLAPEGMNRFAIPYAAMSRFRVDHSQEDDADSNQSHLTPSNRTKPQADIKPLQHWPSLITHLGDEILAEDINLNKQAIS